MCVCPDTDEKLQTSAEEHCVICPFRVLLLTQHALALPGVVVPGLDAVLDLFGDVVGVHVLDGAVHAGPVVVFTGCRSSHHISHLRPGPDSGLSSD